MCRNSLREHRSRIASEVVAETYSTGTMYSGCCREISCTTKWVTFRVMGLTSTWVDMPHKPSEQLTPTPRGICSLPLIFSFSILLPHSSCLEKALLNCSPTCGSQAPSACDPHAAKSVRVELSLSLLNACPQIGQRAIDPGLVLVPRLTASFLHTLQLLPGR